MVDIGLLCLQAKEKFSSINRWLHTHIKGRRNFKETKKKQKNKTHTYSPHTHTTEKTLDLISRPERRH
jgi:hypothetical protein